MMNLRTICFLNINNIYFNGLVWATLDFSSLVDPYFTTEYFRVFFGEVVLLYFQAFQKLVLVWLWFDRA